jgi:predicted ArsR family transcriptional regulator
MQNSTRDKILYLLKTRGALTAATLATELQLTSMGARQQLLKLSTRGDITSYLQAAGKGRPKRFWLLTESGQAHFPDRHSDLTLELIDSISQLFGEAGLEKLIKEREQQTFKKYSLRVSSELTLEKRVKALATIRTEEGYMAEMKAEGECFVLFENHCPICAAAKVCQGFCRSELELFRQLLSDVATIDRSEHQIKGARRCTYKIRPLIKTRQQKMV